MEKDKHDLPSDVEVDGPLNHRQTNSEPQGGKPTATVRPANGIESHQHIERGLTESNRSTLVQRRANSGPAGSYCKFSGIFFL